jgi:hypothetical protein
MTATALAAVGSNANENGTLLISGTAVSASGTSVDFTGIPSWVKRITVMFNGVSTNGTSAYLVQLGSGSITTSGYLSSASYGTTASNATTGLLACANLTASTFQTGICTITNISSNTWVSSSVVGANAGGATVTLCSGGVTLAGVLDRIRITAFNGTDTFDAGTINIMWE